MRKHCAQCGKSWLGRRSTCPRCGSGQVYESGGGWEKPALIAVAAAVVLIAAAPFATREGGYWYETAISAHMVSAVREGPSEEYEDESLWRVQVEVENQGNFDAWISLDYFDFYDEEDWWLECEPDYPVYVADEDRQAWHEVWLPAGRGTQLACTVSVRDGAEERVMEYSTQNYGTGRARTSLSLTGGT